MKTFCNCNDFNADFPLSFSTVVTPDKNTVLHI